MLRFTFDLHGVPSFAASYAAKGGIYVQGHDKAPCPAIPQGRGLGVCMASAAAAADAAQQCAECLEPVIAAHG